MLLRMALAMGVGLLPNVVRAGPKFQHMKLGLKSWIVERTNNTQAVSRGGKLKDVLMSNPEAWFQAQLHGAYKPPAAYKPVELLRMMTRDMAHGERRGFLVNHFSSVAFEFPRYHVQKGVLYYHFGRLPAFHFRPRRVLDVPIRSLFVLELHRWVDLTQWKEPEFWNPVLEEAEKVVAKMYRQSLQAKASERLFCKQDEQEKVWKAIIVRALTKRANAQGIDIVRPNPRKGPGTIRLAANPYIVQGVQRIWSTTKYYVAIQDQFEAQLSRKAPGYKAGWYPLPHTPVRREGGFFFSWWVNPDDVPKNLLKKASQNYHRKRLHESINRQSKSRRFSLTDQFQNRRTLGQGPTVGRLCQFVYGRVTGQAVALNVCQKLVPGWDEATASIVYLN